MAKIIDAYRKDTGQKVRIPSHWFDHPTLGKPFRKTPIQRAREERDATEGHPRPEGK